MKPQIDLFIFWKKLKTPKIHFEINRPLNNTEKKNIKTFIVDRYTDSQENIFFLPFLNTIIEDNLKMSGIFCRWGLKQLS